MTIQFNTDRNIDGNERLEAYVKTSITDELEHFSGHITRIEVHLSDENAGKTGPKDKRCTLEARSENRQPVAVTGNGDTIEKAVSDALEKLKAAMRKVEGKLKRH